MARTEVVATEQGAAVARRDGEASGLVQLAIDRGVDVEVLERLVALQERVTERAAESAMNDAIRRFQELVPLLRKSRTAKIATRSGGSYSYTYAPLSEIVTTIRPILAECGLSYTWDSEVEGGLIRVTCTLYHIDGATRRATFTGPTSSNSGASDIQKVGSALTYGRRQALVQVLGLTQADDDVGGREPVAEDPTPIGKKDLEALRALIKDSGADIDRFLGFFDITSLADLPAARLAEARRLLEAKAGKKP